MNFITRHSERRDVAEISARDAAPAIVANVLEVRGAHADRLDFMTSMAGSGFIDWNPTWLFGVCDDVYYTLIAIGRPPGRDAAKAVAKRLSERWWIDYHKRRDEAAADPYGHPLDLNTLIPIPSDVLRGGHEGARAWLHAHWGCPSILRKISARTDLRRRSESHVETVLIYEFLSEVSGPDAAVDRMRDRWPSLGFTLTSRTLEDIERARRRSRRADGQPARARAAIPRRARPRHLVEPRAPHRRELMDDIGAVVTLSDAGGAPLPLMIEPPRDRPPAIETTEIAQTLRSMIGELDARGAEAMQHLSAIKPANNPPRQKRRA